MTSSRGHARCGGNGNSVAYMARARDHRPVKQPDYLCRRCGDPVISCRADYDAFEQMHYVCFHLTFEHLDAVDADAFCGLAGCPVGALPATAPTGAAESVLAAVTTALGHDPGGWVVAREERGVLRLSRDGHEVLFVAIENPVPGQR